MEWVEALRGKRVAVDTAPLIYYIEDHPDYAERLEPFFQYVAAGEIEMITSVVTLVEVLTQPLRRGDNKIARAYNDFLLDSAGVTTLPLDTPTAQLAAELRADGSLKAPDAIQLATAIMHHADAFLTNDRDFGASPSIQVLRLSELSQT